jgi:dienelactone hydrolase
MRASIVVVTALFAAGCSKKEAKTSEEPAAPAKAATEEAEAAPMAPDIRGEEVTYKAGDTTLVGYVAWDANEEGPRPGVLVVHQWWGHSDYVRKRARMLAELGYTALALDMYGEGRHATHPDDAMKFMNETISNMDVAKERFQAAYDVLKEHGTTNPNDISAIGYCFGGAVVLHMARMGMDLDGVVSFHGNLATNTPAKKGAVKSKVLVLHGEDDPLVPPEQVAAFKEEMEAAGVDYTFIAYPGAKHAFTDESATEKGKKFGMPLEYNAEADEKSWEEMTKFLAALYPPK